MNVFDEILGEIEQTIEGGQTLKATGSWWACQYCHHTYQSVHPATTCPKCKTEIYQWPGDSAEEALKRAKIVQGAQAKAAQEKVVDREAIKKELEERGIEFNARAATATLQKLLEQTITDVGKETPEKVVEEPVQAPSAQAKVEVEVVEDTTPQPANVDQPRDNFKEQRDKAVSTFIAKYKLNEVTPVPVGKAQVQKIGFTKWVDTDQGKRPLFRFFEPFEDVAAFQKVFDAARAEQPATQIDAVQCNAVDNDLLKKCLFKGDLIASLNNGDGTIAARVGQMAELGALKTRRNMLRFVILTVERSQ